MIIALTGHRPPKLGGYSPINPVRDRLKVVLTDYLNHCRLAYCNVTCISGMALGFDQWAAEVCISMEIPFDAAVPFEGQERLWPAAAQKHYRMLLLKARSVEVVSKGDYTVNAMQRRNVAMVDRLVAPEDRLVGVWDGSAGGTGNCVAYAASKGKRFVNLWERIVS